MTIADDRKQGGKKGRRADDRRGAKMNAGTGMQDREASARQELSRIRRRQRGLIGAITGFSIFVNLLMLTGPLYMLQIYDRVLGSGSEETLLVLSVLVAFLFLMMGLLDFARGRIAARVGARLQETLDGRVFRAALGRAEATGQPQTGLQDLESVQRLLSAPAFLALFDLPWTPLFIAAIFLFHPWLGYLALGGGAVLVAITLLNRARTAEPLADAARGARAADRTASQLQQDAELIRSLGMKGAALTRWQRQRRDALTEQMRAADRGGGYTVATKTLRLFLQSAMLGLGAYLVLQGQMTAGAMIAASILLGRALAPVEQTIGQWALIERAQRGWQALHGLLAAVPPERPRTPLPRPAARLAVNQLTLAPPGHDVPTLRGLSFRVDPGQAVGVIGPSGAGKSTLARALCGVWRPSGGTIRLDGAALDQYDPDVLGQLIGYLPQQVTLFDGTIADNIARLSPEPDIDAIHRAAAAAAADTMIRSQVNGYDTAVSAVGGRLSGGQMQRIGLARALYGDPVLLVLDEPNSNLDNEGSEALNAAIRQVKADGRSVLIMAHRPAAIAECDMLLVLDGGRAVAFGPRDEVLAKTVKNVHAIQGGRGGAGGVS